jgi:hypothetical protein
MTPEERAVLDAASAWYDVNSRVEPADTAHNHHRVKKQLSEAVRAWRAAMAAEKKETP